MQVAKILAVQQPTVYKKLCSIVYPRKRKKKSRRRA